MFESFILGAVQGIAEWLPVSSEAMIVLVKSNFFADGSSFSEIISLAIFLHLGTLLAVIVYYWKKIVVLTKQLFHYRRLHHEEQQYINFIIIATGISGILGIFLLKGVKQYEQWFSNETIINLGVAGFLLITALLLYFSEKNNSRKDTPLTSKRAVLTGIFQGCAAIPGISRSGATVAGMGLLGIDKERSLELSFILSIPLVFLANIVLNIDTFIQFNAYYLIALISSFVFGLLTIEILLRVVKKIRFSYFVAVFAIILIIMNFVLL